MKKITLLLLLFVGMTNAQQLTFTDPEFKANLLLSDASNGIAMNFADQYIKIDTNSNGEIEQSEANLVKKIFITSDFITSIDGIEGFMNLQILWIHDAMITDITLAMPTIKELDIVNAGELISVNATGMTGLEKVYCTFQNASLTTLNFSGCSALNDVFAVSNPSLATVDFSGCSALSIVELGACAITNLNMSGCSSLTSLQCYNNQLSELDLGDAVLLQTLHAAGNPISNIVLNAPNTLQTAWFYTDQAELDLSNYTALEDLELYGILPIDVDLHGCTALTTPDFQYNVVNLDLSDCTSLTNVGLAASILESINLENTPQLTSVFINAFDTPNTVMTTFDVSNHPNLFNVMVNNVPLTSFNTDNCPALNQISLYKTALSSVVLNGHPNLAQIVITENPVLTELDLSMITAPDPYIMINANPQLTYINLKNGVAENFNLISNSGNTIFICQDEQYITQTLVNVDPLESTDPMNCNSYCSFVPGGDYNTITGTVLFDGNNNGCGTGDTTRPDIKVFINDGATSGSTFTSNNGNYNFYTGSGSFDLSADFENSSFFNITPAAPTVVFADNNNNTTIQNFCLTSNGVHPDAEIAIAPIIPARPGFTATYQIVIKNTGNQTLSGNFTLAFEDDLLEFSSATQAPVSQATGLLSWSYANLAPFENRSIYVLMNVNSPMQTPPVNGGDILTYTVTVNPIAGDENPSNNQLAYDETVVNSFDPNEITCIEGNIVPIAMIGQYLHYIANFENLGTAEATNVVVRIEVDTDKYDVGSLQLLNTSHEAYTRVTGNVVEFIFENINLAAADGNPPVGGHGNVLFKIRTNGSLAQNDFVNKAAGIYFDYNFPIDTNIAQTVFQTLSVPGLEDRTIKISPNPVTNTLNVLSDFNIRTVSLFDAQGRILETIIADYSAASLDLSGRESGIYFIKVVSDNGIKIEKIVKK